MGDFHVYSWKEKVQRNAQQLGVVALQDACDLASFVVFHMIGEGEKEKRRYENVISKDNDDTENKCIMQLLRSICWFTQSNQRAKLPVGIC